MYSLLITKKDFENFSENEKNMLSELKKIIVSKKELTCSEFLKENNVQNSISKCMVLHAKCIKLYESNKSKKHPYDILKKAYENCGGDLRTQETILKDYQEEEMYDVWTYFKKFRDKTVSMNTGLKHCKKLIKHEVIAYGQKRVYPLSELEKLK